MNTMEMKRCVRCYATIKDEGTLINGRYLCPSCIHRLVGYLSHPLVNTLSQMQEIIQRFIDPRTNDRHRGDRNEHDGKAGTKDETVNPVGESAQTDEA